VKLFLGKFTRLKKYTEHVCKPVEVNCGVVIALLSFSLQVHVL